MTLESWPRAFKLLASLLPHSGSTVVLLVALNPATERNRPRTLRYPSVCWSASQAAWFVLSSTQRLIGDTRESNVGVVGHHVEIRRYGTRARHVAVRTHSMRWSVSWVTKVPILGRLSRYDNNGTWSALVARGLETLRAHGLPRQHLGGCAGGWP